MRADDTDASASAGGPLAAALVPPPLGRDLEYARGKAAVAATLFDESPAHPRVGRYELRRRLGAGGMGEVYAAFDPALGREVALKLTRADRPSAGGEVRLLREARLLARLSHPHVVPIHEVGVVDGHVYLAMALVRGRTLRAWQREAPRAWQATVRVYVAAARGLAAVHAAGLVHCDFKPDNALVDADGHVYVVDFGLAQATERVATTVDAERPGAGEPSTRTGGGTVGYAAPEQLAGRPPDARSDVHALCVSLFEALHGWLPGRDEPLPRRRPAHPRWLDRELARGMAGLPERRHPSLAALCAVLERDPGRLRRRLGLAGGLLALGGLAGAWLPRPPPMPDVCAGVERGLDDVWNPVRRAALAAAFRGSGLPLALSAWERVDAALSAHVDAWRAARRRLCEAAALHAPATLEARRLCLERGAHAVTALLARLAAGERAAVERASAAVAALPPVTACATTSPGRAPAHPAVEALRRELASARAHAATGDHAGARGLAEGALARARTLDDPGARADALLAVGELQAERGEIAPAEATLLDGIDTAEAAGEDDLAARGWLELTFLAARHQLDPERASLWARRAAAALDRLGDHGPRRAALLHALGVAAARAERHDEAARRQREALARAGADPGARAVRVQAQQSLASALEALARNDEARMTFEAALAAAEELYGPHHPQYARVAHDAAILLTRQGEGARARGLLTAALAIWRETYGGISLEAGRAHTALAHEAVQAGELGRAEHHGRRALALFRELLPPDHEDLPAALLNLGVIAHWRGDHEAALVAYREVAALQERALPPGHLDRAVTASNAGESLLALGRHAEALASFAVAEPIVRAAPTLDHELLGLVLAGEGAALAALGRREEARAALTEARAAAARALGGSGVVADLDARLAGLVDAPAAAQKKIVRGPDQSGGRRDSPSTPP